jgi:hypothetical protein
MGKALHNTDDAEIAAALERGGQALPPPAQPKESSDGHLSGLEECSSCHDLFLIQQVMLCDGGQILCGGCAGR